MLAHSDGPFDTPLTHRSVSRCGAIADDGGLCEHVRLCLYDAVNTDGSAAAEYLDRWLAALRRAFWWRECGAAKALLAHALAFASAAIDEHAHGLGVDQSELLTALLLRGTRGIVA